MNKQLFVDYLFINNYLERMKILKNLFVRKKIYLDIFLNIISSLLITAVSQLVVYPILSNEFSAEKFGSILTLMGLSNAIAVIFGGTLNNIRLLRHGKYVEEKCDGDYYYILRITQVLTIITMAVGIIFFRNQITLIESIFLIILTSLTMLRSYMNVYYRINLNYKLIMIHMLAAAVGYILGIPLLKLTQLWPVIFLSGELIAFVFALKTTKFFSEPKIKTSLLNKTVSDSIQLLTSNFMGNILVYLDRLIINPVLGATSVSIYFVASMLGKTAGIVLKPISGVLLSYLARAKENNSKKIYLNMMIIIFLSGIVSILLFIPATPIVTKILYPKSLVQAAPYFFLANLASILSIMGSLLQPVVLKYCPLWWQIVIQIIYTIIYVAGGVGLMISMGLYGFCIAAVAANLSRYVLIALIGYYYIIYKNPRCVEVTIT